MYETFLKDVLRDMTPESGPEMHGNPACARFRGASRHGARRPRRGLESRARWAIPRWRTRAWGGLPQAATRRRSRRRSQARRRRQGRVRAAPRRLEAKGFFHLARAGGIRERRPRHLRARTRGVRSSGLASALLGQRRPKPPRSSRAATGASYRRCIRKTAAFLEEIVAGIAPHHGRLFLGHPKIEMSPGRDRAPAARARRSRARGRRRGLGGARGLALYMQRVALEGSRPVITEADRSAAVLERRAARCERASCACRRRRGFRVARSPRIPPPPLFSSRDQVGVVHRLRGRCDLGTGFRQMASSLSLLPMRSSPPFVRKGREDTAPSAMRASSTVPSRRS